MRDLSARGCDGYGGDVPHRSGSGFKCAVVCAAGLFFAGLLSAIHMYGGVLRGSDCCHAVMCEH